MKIPKTQRARESLAATWFAEITRRLVERGFDVRIRSYGPGERTHLGGSVVLVEGVHPYREEHAGEFSIAVAGNCVGRLDYVSCSGVGLAICGELFGEAFVRNFPRGYAPNDPATIEACLERAAAEQERRRLAQEKFDAECRAKSAAHGEGVST
jgi:hypothetical protein